MDTPQRKTITFKGLTFTWDEYVRAVKENAVTLRDFVHQAEEGYKFRKQQLDELKREFFREATTNDFERGDIVRWQGRNDSFIVVSGRPIPNDEKTILRALANERNWFHDDLEGFVVITNSTHYYKVKPNTLTKTGSLINNKTSPSTGVTPSTQATQGTEHGKTTAELQAKALHAAYRV